MIPGTTAAIVGALGGVSVIAAVQAAMPGQHITLPTVIAVAAAGAFVAWGAAKTRIDNLEKQSAKDVAQIETQRVETNKKLDRLDAKLDRVSDESREHAAGLTHSFNTMTAAMQDVMHAHRESQRQFADALKRLEV